MILRKNLSRKFHNVLQNTFSIISVPNGYGKTSYMKQFLKKEKIKNIWINGRDECDSEHIWNTLIDKAHHLEIIPQSVCMQRLPDSHSKIATLLEEWDQSMHKHVVVVLDDFQYMDVTKFDLLLKNSKQVETKYIHFVVLTSHLFSQELIKLYEHKKCYTMSLHDFKLDLVELIKVFKKANLDTSQDQIEKLLEYTKGYLPAIELAIESSQKGGNLFDTTRLEELLSRGKFKEVDEFVIISLIKLSLFDSFTIEQMRYICEHTEAEQFINQLIESQLFIEKPDLDTYVLTPMFKSYLTNAMIRYPINKQEVYEHLADWFIEQGEPLQAIQKLKEGGCYETLIRMLLDSEINYTDIAPELIQDVFDCMPMKYKYENPIVYLGYILDVMTNIDPYKAMGLLERFKMDLDNHKYVGDYKKLMGEYHYILAFSKFNDVKLMMKDFHKAYDYLEGKTSSLAYPSMIASFGSYQILYLYHHTPGQLYDLVETIRKEIECFVLISQGCNAGSDLQVLAEYEYITGNYEQVESLANAAYKVAYINRQTSICICASFQLARLALLQDNQSLFNASIQNLQELYEKTNIPILLREIESALAFLYILKGEEHKVEKWIVDGKINPMELMHESEGLPYIVNMLYLLKRGRYVEAKASCQMIAYENQLVTHAFALIFAKLGLVIVYFHTGEKEQAYTQLRELLAIAQKDQIISIFIEYYKELYPIFTKYKISNDFEKEVYSKIKARIKYNTNQEKNDLKELTEREQEVARLYVDSYTAKEIALKLMISHNTVLGHLKTIYAKLEINKKKELMERLDRRKQKQ